MDPDPEQKAHSSTLVMRSTVLAGTEPGNMTRSLRLTSRHAGRSVDFEGSPGGGCDHASSAAAREACDLLTLGPVSWQGPPAPFLARMPVSGAQEASPRLPPSPQDSISMPPKKRTRRTPEQIIADLHAEISRIKSRAAEQKAKKDPARRHISGAVRSIDKAFGETKDNATRAALTEARATLSACLTLNGTVPVSGLGIVAAKARATGQPDADKVFDYIRKHPGSRSEEICGELGTSAASLRPVLHRLRDEGIVRVEGRARATRYSAKK